MALTMDERCEIFKRFNATFHGKMDDCKDIPNSLEDGIKDGKRYGRLLTTMDSRTKIDEWLG